MSSPTRPMKTPYPLVLAITGASGAVYSMRLLEVLLNTGYDVHLVISSAGRDILKQELDLNVDLDDFQPAALMLDAEKSTSDSRLVQTRRMAGIITEESNVLSFGVGKIGTITYNKYDDFFAPIASGSFLTTGMVICPASGNTIASVAHGQSNNLILRAAEVHLKERRTLILVPRETPISALHLENMRRAAEVGAVILPASPGWYHGVKTVHDLVDFIVGRILDQLGIAHSLVRRWGEDGEDEVVL